VVDLILLGAVLALEDVGERLAPRLKVWHRKVERVAEPRQVARYRRKIPPPILVGRRP
jgi:hypothetical protein